MENPIKVLGQVVDVKDDVLELNFLAPKKGSEKERNFWIWPDKEDKDSINKDCTMGFHSLSLHLTLPSPFGEKLAYFWFL